MQPTFYITTPIYYVNDLPHIGHIYTTVVADVIARYKRLRGFDVRFLTGTDEHGIKIDRAARAQGIEPKQLADRVVGRYHELWRALEITNDDFIRTTDPRHRDAVQQIIRALVARGDIYKGSYEGWYCAGCEEFVPETQLVDGRCPDQGHPVERMQEGSYFFRLSAYQERLLAWYRENPSCIRPESRYNEVVRFVEGGLRDLSVSRVSLRWGIPWPDDERHVVYVWLDALTNYIAALGYGSPDQALFERYWPADLHLIGKDIIRFHCVYWPAFLLSAGLPLPRQVFAHGWWLRDEQKMSKSVGNVVRPDALLERFGPDPVRHFLLREMTFGQDSNFSDEAFIQRYNADLANGLGNAASRTLAMARRYFSGRTPGLPCFDNDLRHRAPAIVDRWRAAMDSLELQRALEAVWELLSTVDGYINDRAPWSIFKAEGGSSGRLHRILYNALEALRLVAVMVAPVMPGTSRRLLDQLGVGGEPIGEAALVWGGLPLDRPLGPEGPLFPRVDAEDYFKEASVEPNDRKGDQEQPHAQPRPDVPRPSVGDTMPPTESAAAGPSIRPTETAEPIDYEQFSRIKLKVGTVRAAERVPKSKKLVRIEVDLGEPEPRQIVAGIGAEYEPEALIGRQIVVVANLQPATLMGVESRGMLLAATVDGAPVLLGTDRQVPNGSAVK